VLTAGVDLATEPERTALAVPEWTTSGASVRWLMLNVDDDAIVEISRRVSALGLDCPLGWPDDFLAFVQAHHAGPCRGASGRRRQGLAPTVGVSRH
jgi:hypothetical protein